MSYGRNPHYIIHNGDGIEVMGQKIFIPDNILNALLYKMLLKNRREELTERLKAGKNEWLQMESWSEEQQTTILTPKDDPEYQMMLRFFEINEDDFVKSLLR